MTKQTEVELLQMYLDESGLQYDATDPVVFEAFEGTLVFASFKLRIAMGDLWQALGGWRFVWMALLIYLVISLVIEVAL